MAEGRCGRNIDGCDAAASGVDGPEPQGRSRILAVSDDSSKEAQSDAHFGSVTAVARNKNEGWPRSWMANLEAPKFPSPDE